VWRRTHADGAGYNKFMADLSDPAFHKKRQWADW
jgi:hypothetical protein